MKFEDESQNLRLRLRIIQVVVVVLLGVLGTRLYFLQVVNGAYYAERAENQRVRRLPIPAQRGTIFDRNGKILVDSRPTYNVILSREEMRGREYASLAAPLSEGLGVHEELLIEQQPQRRYLENGVLAHVLGYVGEVNPKQLEKDDFRKKGLKPGDV